MKGIVPKEETHHSKDMEVRFSALVVIQDSQ